MKKSKGMVKRIRMLRKYEVKLFGDSNTTIIYEHRLFAKPFIYVNLIKSSQQIEIDIITHILKMGKLELRVVER